MPSPPSALISLLVLGGLLFPELRQPPSPGKEAVKVPVLAALGHPDAGALRDKAGWRPKRDRIQGEWKEILGPFPAPVPLNTALLAREELPDHSRLRVRYAIDPQTSTEAYLLLPKGFRGRRPGMVVLHQTTPDHLEEPVGLKGRETMHLALHLVRRGFVCIVPQNFLWSRPGITYQQITDEVLRPKSGFRWKTGMARMTWDAIRATDVLAVRPEVDRRRIGSMGHSLGGKEVLYHAAFDERIRAAVSCEGGIGLTFSNWNADWYLGKQIQAEDFRLDHHEVLALVAPRAFLLIGGESADGVQSWPYVEAVLPIWRLYGAEERLGLLRHGQGHDFPGPGPERERIFAWLDHWLAK